MYKQLILILFTFFYLERSNGQTVTVLTTYSHVSEYNYEVVKNPTVKNEVLLRPTKWDVIMKDNRVSVVYNGFIKYSVISSTYNKDFYELVVYNHYFMREFNMNIFLNDKAIAIQDNSTRMIYYYYN